MGKPQVLISSFCNFIVQQTEKRREFLWNYLKGFHFFFISKENQICGNFIKNFFFIEFGFHQGAEEVSIHCKKNYP
jgi:hypothetical protein